MCARGAWLSINTQKKLKGNKMEILFLIILLISALVIVVSVLFQKSDEGGLSSAIAGGSETYYGKDKSAHHDRRLFKITLIAAIVFAVAVLAVYVIQPDYTNARAGFESWWEMSNYSSLFDETHTH